MGKKDKGIKGIKLGNHTTNGMAVAMGHNCAPFMRGGFYQMKRYGGLLCQPTKEGFRCTFCGKDPGNLRMPATPLPTKEG